MQAPDKPASQEPKTQMTSAEFFGVPNLAKAAPPAAVDHSRPDWYQDWLGEDKLKQDFVVWFDAWEAFNWFISFESQWFCGFDGPTGLNYTSVLSVIALYYPRKTEQQKVFEDIKAIERGAIAGFNEQRKQAKDKAEQDKT